MYISWIWSVWNWSLKLKIMYFPIQFYKLKFERFSLKFHFWENRGMLPHDRDIVYHDRERSSTSRALLGLTVLDNLVCSRSHITTVRLCLTWHRASRSWPCSRSTITIVTVCEADSGVLTTDHHDRDHTLPARDLQKRNKKWFLIGLVWFIFSLFWGFCLVFWGVTILVSERVLGPKLGFEGWKMCWMLCILINMRFFVLNHGVWTC